MNSQWGLVKEKARILMSSTNTGLGKKKMMKEQPELNSYSEVHCMRKLEQEP